MMWGRREILDRTPVFVPADDDQRAQLVSMWVAPNVRRSGAERALGRAVLDWSRARDLPEVELWVTETSLPARTLYEGLGFSASGEEQPLPSDPRLNVVRMVRRLSD